MTEQSAKRKPIWETLVSDVYLPMSHILTWYLLDLASTHEIGKTQFLANQGVSHASDTWTMWTNSQMLSLRRQFWQQRFPHGLLYHGRSGSLVKHRQISDQNRVGARPGGASHDVNDRPVVRLQPSLVPSPPGWMFPLWTRWLENSPLKSRLFGFTSTTTSLGHGVFHSNQLRLSQYFGVITHKQSMNLEHSRRDPMPWEEGYGTMESQKNKKTSRMSNHTPIVT